MDKPHAQPKDQPSLLGDIESLWRRFWATSATKQPYKAIAGVVVGILILMVLASASTTSNTVNQGSAVQSTPLPSVAAPTKVAVTLTPTPKPTMTPTVTPAHDAVLSKYLDVFYDASNIGGKVTAWQVTWLSGNSVRLQRSVVSGTDQKTSLTETDIIKRFASTSEASNYVQSSLGNAAYRKTLSGPFYAECWAYKLLTGQQPTVCDNYDSGVSAYGPGKAITQANEIVTTSDYVNSAV